MQERGEFYNSVRKMHPIDGYYIDLYAYVVIEIPFREEINVDVLDQNLSLRIYWGHRNLFWGRRPEEIKFKPGDIVEILGCPGNFYWGNETVDLAIVVKTPPTIGEVEKMRKQYYATHSGYDLCDHALSIEFGHCLDTYELIPYALGSIDHAPTICVFAPTKQVSSRRKKALMEMYKKYGK